MPYEIPQKLQYEEKIIFGLTFKQLVYSIIFIFPALIIFLKTNFNIYVKVSIAVILVGLAALFMFFSFSSYVSNMLTWFKFREILLMESKMIQFLGIEKIENGVIYVWKSKKPIKKS